MRKGEITLIAVLIAIASALTTLYVEEEYGLNQSDHQCVERSENNNSLLMD